MAGCSITCAVEGCGAPKLSHHLLCGEHWALVPADLQEAVRRSWEALLQQPGDHEAIAAHQAACVAAIAAATTSATVGG